MVDNRVEQGHEVARGVVSRQAGPALAGTRVEHREHDLLFVSVEVQEELFDFVDHFGDAGVGTVNLVDDENNRQALFQRLAQNEASLGERAFGGVDEEHHAVDHRKTALNFATKVGVTRGVDDVDGHVVETNGRVLGEDGDALLTLEVARVHNALRYLLVFAK